MTLPGEVRSPQRRRRVAPDATNAWHSCPNSAMGWNDLVTAFFYEEMGYYQVLPSLAAHDGPSNVWRPVGVWTFRFVLFCLKMGAGNFQFLVPQVHTLSL